MELRGAATEAAPARGRSISIRSLFVPGALVLLLFSGFFKASPHLAWIPVDLTLLAAALVTASLIVTVVARRLRVPVPPGGLVLAAALLPGFVVGVANPYTPAARLSLLLSALSGLGAYWLLTTRQRQQWWVWLHVAVGVGVLLLASASTTTGRLAVTQTGTIAAAQGAGVAIVVLVVMLLTGGLRGWVKKLAAAGLCVACTQLLIETGSRGPAAFVAVTVLAVALTVHQRGVLRRALIVVAVFAGGWYFLDTTGGAGADRLRQAVSGQIDNTATRDVIWQQALAAIPTEPLGVGWGNFWSVLTSGAVLDSGYRQYPHNVMLEAFIEGGWIAGVAVTAFIVVGLLRLRRQATDTVGAALFGIALFFALCSMVSGSIGDNRAMFAAVAVGYVVRRSDPTPAASPEDRSQVPESTLRRSRQRA